MENMKGFLLMLALTACPMGSNCKECTGFFLAMSCIENTIEARTVHLNAFGQSGECYCKLSTEYTNLECVSVHIINDNITDDQVLIVGEMVANLSTQTFFNFSSPVNITLRQSSASSPIQCIRFEDCSEGGSPASMTLRCERRIETTPTTTSTTADDTAVQTITKLSHTPTMKSTRVVNRNTTTKIRCTHFANSTELQTTATTTPGIIGGATGGVVLIVISVVVAVLVFRNRRACGDKLRADRGGHNATGYVNSEFLSNTTETSETSHARLHGQQLGHRTEQDCISNVDGVDMVVFDDGYERPTLFTEDEFTDTPQVVMDNGGVASHQYENLHLKANQNVYESLNKQNTSNDANYESLKQISCDTCKCDGKS